MPPDESPKNRSTLSQYTYDHRQLLSPMSFKQMQIQKRIKKEKNSIYIDEFKK